MSDFAAYEPNVSLPRSSVPVRIRPAAAEDGDDLAEVMAVRGGRLEDYLIRAGLLIERLEVLLVAEIDESLVGWCGIQKSVIYPGGEPGWLVAGLTVVPEQRRRGVAARLLRGVLVETAVSAPGESIFSVINARNRGSLDLHERLGFAEVARAATFAGIDFTGGEGVLLQYS